MKILHQLLSICLATLIFSPGLLRASSDLKNGYYVSASGDTIQGLIVFESGSDNYITCRYKASKNAKTQNFGPDQIRAYSVEGKRLFISHSEQIRGEMITVFFEVLIKGEITLYRYKERFYLESANQMKWLHIDESKEEKDGKVYTTYSKHHIKIIFDAFETCPELKREISSGKKIVLIREKNLVRLVEAYYSCSGKEFKVYKKLSSQNEELQFSKIRIGLHVGMSTSNIRMPYYNSGTNIPLPNPDFGRPLTYGLGLSFEYSAPRINERTSFVIEPYFQQYNFQGFAERMQEGKKVQGELSLRFKEIIIPFGVKYVVLSNWNDFYISLGLSQQFYFGQEFISKRKVEDISSGSITDSEASLRNIRKSQLGAWFGTGILLIKRPEIRVPFQIRFQSLGLLVEPYRSTDPIVSIENGYYGYILFLVGAQF